MTDQPKHPLFYKDISYSQLRSYCETARLGSMSAAAKSLQLSHPTVWKQIRALEQLLGTTLMDSSGRKSELTEAGIMFARLAAPIVKEFETLQDRFQEGRAAAPRHLLVAAPPRSFTDDLMPCLKEFRTLRPDIHLVMREGFFDQGNLLLEEGEVDIVIGDVKGCHESDRLIVEKLYEIEMRVIMPMGHPLSRRKKILAEDLAEFPVLNLPEGYPDDEGRLILQNAGVFDHPDRGFELVLASSIRACVKRGLGIGLVGRVLQDAPGDPDLCERSLKHFLRPTTCYAYRLRRITENPTHRAFLDLLKSRLAGRDSSHS